MVLLCMIFLHILDDFYLQSNGFLGNGKQKRWWVEQKSFKYKYQFDYIPALLLHAFSWTFMVMLPICKCYDFQLDIVFYVAFAVNFLIHAITDDLKANEYKINLVQDQIMHILQILITFFGFYIYGVIV